MKKLIYAINLSLVLMLSVAGCGSSGSGDGSYTLGGSSGTISGGGTVVDSTQSGSITLAWDAPTTSDGTPLPNVVGYNVYLGTSPGDYSTKIKNGVRTTCAISGLAPGTYYVAVTCYNSSGTESSFSNEASKIIE